MQKTRSMLMLSLISPMRGNDALIQISKQLSQKHQADVSKFEPLGGGDINEVYLVKTTAEKYVLKVNDAKRFPGMFSAEKEGLEELSHPGVIRIPKVIGTGEVGEKSYILMEFIEAARPGEKFSQKFGKQLAALHKTTAREFGYKIDNYIGSLPQYNAPGKTAAEFYISQRLEPQFKMARDKGFYLGDPAFLYKKCEELIPKEPPALVHGDLWGGNYLVDNNGDPCLIDPAVAYAPREMDLGMMKLFGGFDREIFTSYHENFPMQDDFEERVGLWQLYYLLVHLNIFGSSYKSQVSAILRQYS